MLLRGVTRIETEMLLPVSATQEGRKEIRNEALTEKFYGTFISGRVWSVKSNLGKPRDVGSR